MSHAGNRAGIPLWDGRSKKFMERQMRREQEAVRRRRAKLREQRESRGR